MDNLISFVVYLVIGGLLTKLFIGWGIVTGLALVMALFWPVVVPFLMCVVVLGMIIKFFMLVAGV